MLILVSPIESTLISNIVSGELPNPVAEAAKKGQDTTRNLQLNIVLDANVTEFGPQIHQMAGPNVRHKMVQALHVETSGSEPPEATCWMKVYGCGNLFFSPNFDQQLPADYQH